jgi:hypothetical protein
MKQLLLATATLVGLSSAALAGEPAALTDSQLDNVIAGLPVASAFPAVVTLPVAIGVGIPGPGFVIPGGLTPLVPTILAP